jgi:hypothetical protein
MRNPEDVVTELLEKNRENPPKNGEELLRLVKLILQDRFEVVESIAKACGSPQSHKCRCGEVYFFLPTKAGKFQPIVPDEGISHFITCRYAPHYRDVGKRCPETPPPGQGESR